MNKDNGGQMLKRDARETEILNVEQLTKILDENYAGESDLCRSVLQTAINQSIIYTEFELEQAYETVSSLNDWPEDEGYGSSDRAFDLRSIQKAVAHNREFLKAEQELIIINNLKDFPKVNDVLNYMAMNRNIQNHFEKEVA
jgi:hypothetical protein